MKLSFKLLTLLFFFAQSVIAQDEAFQILDEMGSQKPWSHENFANDPEAFQFAIVSDRTGGHRPGIFGKAVHKLNLLQPEFVMSVGDFIEGYTKDEEIIQKEWQEFDSLLQPLEAPFFYLPGNHDISNDVMREAWNAKYGKSYYAFIYQNVLFISMDTNDGDGVTLGDEQLAYVQKVIREHPEVRWTMLFMHHPIWDYQDLSGFQDIEASLEGRDYTVIAGHRHRYLYEERYDKNYITLATTGGGSQLRGPSFGEFDQVVWVSMTKDEGPVIVNIALDGIIEKDIVNIHSKELASALISSSDMPYEILTKPNDSKTGRSSILLQNQSKATMRLKASLLHHHQLQANQSQWDISIEPGDQQEISFHYQANATKPSNAQPDPFILNWTLSYEVDSLKSMVLSGQKLLEVKAHANLQAAPEQDKFMDQLDLAFEYPFAQSEIRYTLDGSTPIVESELYQSPIQLRESKEVQLRVFSDALAGPVHSYQFEKVKPIKAQKVRKPKAGLTYEYFEGEWKNLPDFDKLTVINSGITKDLDVEKVAGEREDHFGIRYRGYLEIAEEGMYTFDLNSDDGARVLISNMLVVENDGSHSSSEKSGNIALSAGFHPIEIQYFEDFLGEELKIEFHRNHQDEKLKLQEHMYHK